MYHLPPCIIYWFQVIQYREQSDLAFTLLVKSQHLENPISLDELMQYPLTPVPHSLGTPDGYFSKTDKSTVLPYLVEDASEETHYPANTLYIQDGNALFHVLTDLPATMGAICLKVLDQMISKRNFVFSTDSYHEDSIKAQERLRRGCSDKFLIDGPATRKPKEFKTFLSNDENKVQLCQLLLRVWGSKAAASRLKKAETAVVIVDGKAFQLQESNGQVMNKNSDMIAQNSV